MAIYTSVSDVELEWGRAVPNDSLGNVAWLIDKAESIIIGAVPGIADRITAGRATAFQVAQVAASMVVRVLRNPEGKQAETAGDYSYQLASGAAGGTMYLSAGERNLLRGRGRAASLQYVDDALEHPLRRPPFVQECREWTVIATGEAP